MLLTIATLADSYPFKRCVVQMSIKRDSKTFVKVKARHVHPGNRIKSMLNVAKLCVFY